MTGFSIGKAIGDGFDLVGKRPVSVFVWGLLMVAPNVGAIAVIMPVMGEIIASAPAGAGSADAFSDAMMSDMMRIQGLSGLMNILQLVASVVVYTAVMRAVARPRERGFFGVRLGMDELRVAVAGIAVFVGVYAAMIVMMLVGVALGFAVWSAGDPTRWIVIGGMIAVFVAALFWATARVSLIAPASVAEKDFAFAQGWRAAGGHSWALLGMMLLILLLILVVEAVTVAIGVGIFMALGAGGSALDWPANYPVSAMWEMVVRNWPWAALATVICAWLYGVLMTLCIAPYASAYRQLVESRPKRDGDAPVDALDTL